MNPVLREYLAKGVFLGLWAYLALVQPDRPAFARVVGYGVAGLLVALAAGAAVQLRRGYRPGRNPAGFALLVVLDSSYVIYLGVIGGFAVGTFLETDPPPDGRYWLAYAAGGGLALGYGLHQLRAVPNRLHRFGLGLAVGGLLTALAVSFAADALGQVAAQRQFGAYLLCGLPFFYLLTFCGEAEESEAEIAAECAALGTGLYLLRLDSNLPPQFDKVIFLAPLGLYVVYATKWLAPLRVFKHTLRGYGHASLGRTRAALASFGRALALDPRSMLAADGLWRLVRAADFATLDDETAKLLPVEFCLQIAHETLVGSVPTPAARDDAGRMLAVVERQRPDLAPRVEYLRAVALTHAKDFDAAAATLSTLLDPATAYPGDGSARRAVLLPAWQLATTQHPRLAARLGDAELAKPGRRIDALRAVEHALAADPLDPAAADFKRHLYATLTEAEFVAACGAGPPPELNYDYLDQSGRALAADPDPARVERGLAALRMAGRGLPPRAAPIFTHLAEVATKLGRPDEALGYLGQVKRAVLASGSLPADQKPAYLAALTALAAAAEARGDFPAAVDDTRLAVEAGQDGVETLRHLAALYAKAGDPLNALLITERGLLQAKADPDLLAKKDSYYYSVEVPRVAAVRQQVAPWFDVAYCVAKAAAVADQPDADPDTLDYGLHLARLARTVRPDSQAALYAEARLLLRRGDQDAGVRLLEDLREQPRGSGADEDAWFLATRTLGDLYLDVLGRPDLAVACYTDFRQYQRSGADTLYKLGLAHEAAGNAGQARKAFKLVTEFANHPRYYDALAAVRRLDGAGQANV